MNVSDLKCPSCSKAMELSKVSCRECGITIEGNLEISPLGRLSRGDQEFVIAFLKSGGNLTRTGEVFGISYPTVKTRLAALLSKLHIAPLRKTKSETVLVRLEKGEIDVHEAMELLA